MAKKKAKKKPAPTKLKLNFHTKEFIHEGSFYVLYGVVVTAWYWVDGMPVFEKPQAHFDIIFF